MFKFIILGDILNVLFYVSCFYSVMTICVMPSYIEDRLIMVKEKSNGAYKLWVYSLANFLVTIPFTLVLSVSSGLICYYLVGFETDSDKIIVFLLNMFVTLLCTEGLM